MKEFMLLIRNEANSKTNFPEEDHRVFLKACEGYIEKLSRNGNMISAQPLVREGVMVSGIPTAFNEGDYTNSQEVIVGYYHILAKDLSDAVAIAKENPEFAYTTTARVEVRPIKMKEETTAYKYPGGQQE